MTENPSLMSMLSSGMAQGNSPLNQVQQGSPNFDPSLQTPPNAPMPQKSPVSMMRLSNAANQRGVDLSQHPQMMGAQAPAPAAQPQQPQMTLPVQDQNPEQSGTQVPLSEAELILKAMDSRLKHLSKHEQHLTEVLLPKAPSAPQGK